MKKTYIAPVVEGVMMDAEEILAASVTSVGGDSGLGLGTGETPTEADAKSSIFDTNPWE